MFKLKFSIFIDCEKLIIVVEKLNFGFNIDTYSFSKKM